MYKETIVIAGLGSELCNIDQESMVIMHLKDEYLDELPINISEKLACITRDVSHTNKQVAIIEEEQKDFREFLHCHYWDNDFKMGLVYVEDQESTFKNLRDLNNSFLVIETQGDISYILSEYQEGESYKTYQVENFRGIPSIMIPVTEMKSAWDNVLKTYKLILCHIIDNPKDFSRSHITTLVDQTLKLGSALEIPWEDLKAKILSLYEDIIINLEPNTWEETVLALATNSLKVKSIYITDQLHLVTK